jgi:hypothetical protein
MPDVSRLKEEESILFMVSEVSVHHGREGEKLKEIPSITTLTHAQTHDGVTSVTF